MKALQAKAEEEARAKAKAELEQGIATTAEETAKAIEQQKQLEEQLKVAQDTAKAEAEDAAAATELKAAKDRTADLEKKLKLANTDTTVFAVHFEDLQACINKLNGLIMKMEKGEDKETAVKLKTALKTVLTAATEKL